jgi:hypothetical protein
MVSNGDTIETTADRRTVTAEVVDVQFDIIEQFHEDMPIAKGSATDIERVDDSHIRVGTTKSAAWFTANEVDAITSSDMWRVEGIDSNDYGIVLVLRYGEPLDEQMFFFPAAEREDAPHESARHVTGMHDYPGTSHGWVMPVNAETVRARDETQWAGSIRTGEKAEKLAEAYRGAE